LILKIPNLLLKVWDFLFVNVSEALRICHLRKGLAASQPPKCGAGGFLKAVDDFEKLAGGQSVRQRFLKFS